MKRILAWTLALTMGLSLCACGTDSSSVSTSQTTDTVAEQTPAAETSDTIEIGTAEELVTFAKSITDGSKGGYAGQTVVLTADIDCSDVEWTLIGTMNLEDMSDYSCMFQGVFDGQGHTISNVTFDSDYPICGAGIIGMNLSEVKNLTAQNVRIHCTVSRSSSSLYLPRLSASSADTEHWATCSRVLSCPFRRSVTMGKSGSTGIIPTNVRWKKCRQDMRMP